jgi:hypothetical protein
MRESWQDVVLGLIALAIVWTPGYLAFAYWWVTGKSALTLIGW